MTDMFSFLKPTAKSIMVFALLAFICIGGAIQSYAFIDEIPEVPKPPLYDLLKPLELWIPWVLFAAPVHLLGDLLDLWWLLEYFPRLGGVSAPVASLAYAYVISCWATYSWDRWIKHNEYERLVLFIGVVPALVFHLPAMSLLVSGSLSYAVSVMSGFIFSTIVFIVYTLSIYGLYKALKSLLYSRSTDSVKPNYKA